MKKSFLLLASLLVLSWSAAENVTAVKVTIPDVDLAALRVQHPENEAYVQALTELESELKSKNEELKHARKEYKAELSYYKQMSKGVNEGVKSYKSLLKECEKMQKELNKLEKNVNSQYSSANKGNTLQSSDLRERYMETLQSGKRLLDEGSRNNDNLLQRVSKEHDKMVTLASICSTFDLELKQKDGQLKLLESKQKDTLKRVQAEKKSVKQAEKDAAKAAKEAEKAAKEAAKNADSGQSAAEEEDK